MAYTPQREWAFSATDLVLLNDNAHFLYLAVPTPEDSTDPVSIFASEQHIEPKFYPDWICFKIGILQAVVDGKREASMLWGNNRGTSTPQLQADWNQAVNTSPDYIKNKPAIPSGSIELTGDATGTGTTGAPFATTLATVNPNVGTFGSTTKIPVVSVDGKGRVTGLSEVDALTGGAGVEIGDWIEDIAFEFCDVVAGTAKTYTLDIKASFGYTIEAACLETDNGTLTGVAVKIGATAVTSLSSITVDTTVDETASTGAKTVVAGNRVYLVVAATYTGTPTLIRGKLKTLRT